ncbi:MAG TPA: cation-transporting P-type ATPase [Candidatus Dormibacteraeota bacterium]|nr:cation-transporting P-type ATPase [Candidatus Dormibacteraeota bacterium]
MRKEEPAQVESRIAEPGLTSDQAAALLAEWGPNQLVPAAERHGWIDVLWRTVRDPMVLLLLVASVVYLATGDLVDAIVSAVALVPIAAVGLVLEGRSQRALDRLRALTAPTATVLRDGEYRQVPAAEIVPGDVISLREGDVVPADARLVDGANVACDESSLTGESMPVEKAGRDAQVLAGTKVVAGQGVFVVTSTGGRTEYGRVGRLVAELRQAPTPLERLVRRFTSGLLVIALAFCFLVAVAELARGRGLAAALIAGVSLAIAAVPEEFPMVYTLYLALGAWRLARRNALVRRLGGVEGLGAASVICSDKTGTLTTGSPAVAVLVPISQDATHVDEQGLLQAVFLAAETAPFDPLDVAVHEIARERGIQVGTRTILRDYGFDAKARYMSHVWSSDGGFEVAAKGALEGILDRSHVPAATRAEAEAANARLARDGMRVLAVAHGHMARLGRSRHDDEEHLRFVGLVAFADPLRPGVREAIAECRDAGIRVIMITGDHPATARALAAALQMPGSDQVATGADIEAPDRLMDVASKANVFARVRPEQKYILVRELKRQGSIVAMTGDGINDAPALREADIGVAMGKRGTEVAREAATLVLLDDNFSTIVAAVREGRRIFTNLRKAFAYLVAFHLPLLLTAFVIPLLGEPLLLLPVHLVLLELFIHPVVSLVFEDAPAPPWLMRQPPRSAREFLLGRAELLRSTAQGAVLSIAVIALYVWRLSAGSSIDEARATAFVTLVLGQILLLVIERTRPKTVWAGLADFGRTSAVVVVSALALVILMVYMPFAAEILKLTPLSEADWAYAVAISVLATIWAEPLKLLRSRTSSMGTQRAV